VSRVRDILLGVVLFFGVVLAEDASYHGRVEGGYERLYLPGNEAMGLLKVGALFDVGTHFYLGADLYSAVCGRRGGFFTVGVEGGSTIALGEHLHAKGGMFVGAGGGGSAPQGGGLMLRPYAGLAYDMGSVEIEAGVSRVWFPNGMIDSAQLYAALSVPFGGRYWRGHDAHHTQPLAPLQDALGITTNVLIEHYCPASSAHNAHSKLSTLPYSLAGVEFVIGSQEWYSYFQAAGAGAGNATGYMEVFAGRGYRHAVSDTLSLQLQGAIGAAGGGRVDTGGGLMYRADGIVDATIFDRIHLGVRGGTIGSVDGSFKAMSCGATLGYEERFYGLGDPNFLGKDANLTAWRFRLMNKSYLPTKGMFNDNQVNRIDLIGIALNRFVTPNLYLIGESFWAWKGQAGGYAEGIFGLGYQTDPHYRFRLYGEALAGVGGGGDVRMDGGMFGSLGGGVMYDLDSSVQLYVGAARIRSKTGGFSTTSIDMGVHYNFSLFSQ
jgi:hypothetical protein